MHIIDYLPWPIYVLIVTFSILGILKYIVLNKKLGFQEKLGAFMMVFGLTALIVEKIIDETSLGVKFYNILEYSFIPGLFGFVVLLRGVMKKVDDPKKKRELKMYYILFSIVLSLFGIFVIYTLIVKG